MVDGPADERIVVVTGVGNRNGIGLAIARRLLNDGAKVLLRHGRAQSGSSSTVLSSARELMPSFE
jgi:NAD(P)-dependent dehydrogenase (short-subunit alcohol dehydrogenase family)